MSVSVRTVVSEVSSKAQGIALSSGGVTVLTGGTGLKDNTGQASGYGGQLLKVRVNNSGSSQRTVKGYLVASGGSVAEATKLFEEILPAKGYFLYAPRVPDKYKDSATVQLSQDAGTDVLAWAEAVEFY